MAINEQSIRDFFLRCLDTTYPLDVPSIATWPHEAWQYFLQLCQEKRVYPQIYNHLKRYSASIPQEIMESLCLLTKKNGRRNLKLFTELKTLLEAFAKQGIDVILLKGSYLAPVIYPDISERVLRDIDILVSIQDIPATQLLLEKHGYRQQPGKQNVFKSPGELDRYFLYNKDLLPYQKGDLMIEVHQKINYPWGPQIEIDDFWRNSVPIRIFGQNAKVFHPEEFLLHLCLHLTFQDKFTNAPLSLHDIKLFYMHHKNDIDIQQFLLKAKKYKIYKAALACFKLCEEITGLELESQLNQEIQKLISQPMLADARKQVFGDKIPDIYVNFHQAKFINKLSKISKRLFISKDEIKLRYGSPRYAIYYPGLYIWHIIVHVKKHFSFVFRYSRKNSESARRLQMQCNSMRWLDDDKN